MPYSFADGVTTPAIPVINAGVDVGTLWQDPNIALFAPQFAPYTNTLVLLANAAQSFTVPDGYGKICLSCDTAGQAVWSKLNATATIPGATTTNGASSQLNVGCRSVKSGDTVSCIAAANCLVTAEFWA